MDRSSHFRVNAMLERPSESVPTPRQLWRALDRHSLTNGIGAWLMACTGPFVVMLGVAVDAGMRGADINSWVLGAYGFGGVLTIVFSTLYRTPLGIGWTIPGVVLLGNALGHLPFAECVGAFYATGALVAVLGITGWVARIAALIPLGIVMAMVAGVFLPFVLRIVTGFGDDPLVSTVTVLVFVALSANPGLARIAPPLIVAIAAGAGLSAFTGNLSVDDSFVFPLTVPVFYSPEFSLRAMLELVIPLTITVVGIHNLQGFAITEANGYPPPRNTLTTVCGIGSFAFAAVGAVPTCVTGPANGILNTSGEKERRYAGGVVLGVLMTLFGLFAPVTTAIALAFPAAFVALIGGLAMFEVLRGAFLTAFSGKFSIGALTTFVVTVADRPIANIGAPFWAVIFGCAAAYLFERDEWRRSR